MIQLLNRIVLCCFLAAPGFAYAEDVAAPAEHQVSGNIEAGGFKTTGNSETKTLEGQFEVKYAYGQWSSELTFEGSQTSDAGVLTSDNYEAALRGVYDMQNHAYGFVQLGYREDFFSGIYYEKSNIAGMGYHFFTDEPLYDLDAEIGYGMRVSKKLINGIVRPRLDYDPGTHIAIFSKYHFTEKDLIEFNVQAELGNDDEYIKKELAWVHTLFDHLTVNFGYVVKTNSKPEVGTVGTDDKLSVKLGYEF